MNSKWKNALVWLIGIAIVLMIVFIGIKDSIVRPVSDEDADADAMKKEPVDVEAYYRENSEIVAEYDVKISEKIQSEKQAVESISERGFEQYPVTYDYSIDGKYLDTNEAKSENEQHPIYQTYYTSSNNELWTIISINGSVIANPVSYNMESERGVQFIVSESNVITGFDSSKNMFYETIPKESELIVYVVDKIDAETLDALTVEVISGL